MVAGAIRIERREVISKRIGIDGNKVCVIDKVEDVGGKEVKRLGEWNVKGEKVKR